MSKYISEEQRRFILDKIEEIQNILDRVNSAALIDPEEQELEEDE